VKAPDAGTWGGRASNQASLIVQARAIHIRLEFTGQLLFPVCRVDNRGRPKPGIEGRNPGEDATVARDRVGREGISGEAAFERISYQLLSRGFYRSVLAWKSNKAGFWKVESRKENRHQDEVGAGWRGKVDERV